MLRTLNASALLAGMLFAGHGFSQTPSPQDPTPAITAVLNRQVADWNRGDLSAFATGYKNAPDILFIGPKIDRGYASMLARYKTSYPTPAAMGTLSFSRLEVQPLDAHFATVTGRFHLQRSAKDGSDADGYSCWYGKRPPPGGRSSATIRQRCRARAAVRPLSLLPASQREKDL